MIAAGLGYGGLRGEGIRIVVPTPEGAVEAVTLLLERGMDVDAFNTTGRPRCTAPSAGARPVVKLLASRGATLSQEQGGLHAARHRDGAGRSWRPRRRGARRAPRRILRKLAADGGPKAPPTAP